MLKTESCAELMPQEVMAPDRCSAVMVMLVALALGAAALPVLDGQDGHPQLEAHRALLVGACVHNAMQCGILHHA